MALKLNLKDTIESWSCSLANILFNSNMLTIMCSRAKESNDSIYFKVLWRIYLVAINIAFLL